MDLCRAHLYLFSFLCLGHISNAAAVSQIAGSTRPALLRSRANVTLTLLSNATSIVQNLDFTTNCTVSISWYQNLPGSGAGFGNNTINVDFLRLALPAQYQDESDDQIASFYDDMSFGALSDTGWLVTAKDDIETVCITPRFESGVSLSNLDASQNCTATAIFLSSLGWITGIQNYTASSNNTFWLEFLRAALPASNRSSLTDLELLVFRNYFLSSQNTVDITKFLKDGFNACQKDICEVQGYTGNPDIAGIGVISSYSLEAALVTLYFVAINLQIWMEGMRQENKIPDQIQDALSRASEELTDAALFFSLSISTAGWVSFVSGTSYYEKLIFTSANVLALSALFVFLAMFTATQHKMRGGYSLAIIIAAILTESAIQYIVYLTEPNEKYRDYACLHLQFEDEGYHPTIFEALFFLLLGLSILAGIVAAVWLVHSFRATHGSSSQQGHHSAQHAPAKAASAKAASATAASGTSASVRPGWVDGCVNWTRIFIQTVAIVVMWVELVYLWKIRRIMSEIAGATWSEGAWGFGQILALFIWFPPIIDILSWLILPRSMLGLAEGEKENQGAPRSDSREEVPVKNNETSVVQEPVVESKT